MWSDVFLQQTEGFKKRWFTLDHRRLMYFKDPLVRRSCKIEYGSTRGTCDQVLMCGVSSCSEISSLPVFKCLRARFE